MLMLSTLFKLVIVLFPLMIRVSLPSPPSTARPLGSTTADRSMVSFPAPALIVSGRLAASVYVIVSLASPRVSDLTLVSTLTLIF